MGLIGRLEELGLVDVLQMIGLAQKTGVLRLQTPSERGAIALRAGEVFGAWVGEPPPVSPDAPPRSLERDAVEHAVFAMLGWQTGEFCFDLAAGPLPGEPEGALEAGLSVQYLLMEGARHADEVVPASAPRSRPEAPMAAPPQPAHAPEVVFGPTRPVIAIDADLSLLDWLKRSLAPSFERVHVFQRSELGLARVRQYLVRASAPLVVLSPAMPVDQMAGMVDAADFARRLRAQAPGLGLVWLLGDEEAPPAGCPVDAVFARPAAPDLGPQGGEALRVALCRLARGPDGALPTRGLAAPQGASLRGGSWG